MFRIHKKANLRFQCELPCFMRVRSWTRWEICIPPTVEEAFQLAIACHISPKTRSSLWVAPKLVNPLYHHLKHGRKHTPRHAFLMGALKDTPHTWGWVHCLTRQKLFAEQKARKRVLVLRFPHCQGCRHLWAPSTLEQVNCLICWSWLPHINVLTPRPGWVVSGPFLRWFRTPRNIGNWGVSIGVRTWDTLVPICLSIYFFLSVYHHYHSCILFSSFAHASQKLPQTLGRFG